ncbi:hypothetical protein EW146_g6424 [Bondarzewia mesenterica]|uniref:NAD(P)-binding protein n=1 Tax=Bondarzewia mesenterica TaxID=1095465 RepID=A0A4S4LNP9_9AGAM|nr:hypothetical protein EW146_g6424 [Bondarzewia mesenterica]
MTNYENTRVWLITGASSGLGKALVNAVLGSNERVVAAVRNTSALAELQAKYRPEQLAVLPLDVTNTAQIDETFKFIERTFHRLDVVVNMAGYGLCGEIEGTPDTEARKQIEVIFWGPVNITKKGVFNTSIRMFRDVNPAGLGGRVLNVSSAGGYAANTSLAFYSAGKFALEGFTEAFNREMPPEWNIKGIIIEPGGFPTNWGGSGMTILPFHPAYDENSPSHQFRRMRENYPDIGDVNKAAKAMIRIAGEPDPPQRLQLGSDCWGIVTMRARKTIQEAEEWAEVSHGTNQDGYNGMDVLAQLKEAL